MNTVLIVGAMAFFGLVHSLTAMQSVKDRVRHALGDRMYHGLFRLLYNIFSVLTLAPTLLAVALLPDRTLYTVPLPWSVLFVFVQVAAALGALVTLLTTDLLRFLGLRQLHALVSHQPLPLPAPRFTRAGSYAYVRHPLYLFSLITIWATPIMTGNVLLFNLGATAYLVIGSFPEERKLLRVFGADYRQYQESVPRILPLPRQKRTIQKA